MFSYHTRRRWAARLGLSTLPLLMVGLGTGPAHASLASLDVAAFAGRPGAQSTTATGKVGDVVKVTVGIHNKGPDKIVWKGVTYAAEQTWKFTLPPGTEAVAGPQGARPPNGWAANIPNPDTCFNQTGEGYAFGPGPYDCWSAKIFEAGASSQVTFHLKITKVIPDATGTVEIDRDFDDSESDNDKASVIINPDPVDTIGGVSVTRSTALGAALLLLLAVGGALLYLRARHRPGNRQPL